MRWRRREEMSTQRKRYSAEFKARVALDAVKGLKTVNELASTYGVHPTQITPWNQQLQKEVPEIFSARRAKREHDHEAFQAQLYQQIGQLKAELDWLKKKLVLPPEAKRELIEPVHPQISMARQCDLVGLPRSTYYYQAQGESAENLYLMRLLDKQYTDTPYYGVRRMTAWLRRQGYAVNHKRVARLLRTMGVETIYPKPRLSQPHPTHRVYPYLLRGVPITRVNQVWSTDITSVRLLWWVYLPGRRDGLVQSVCAVVGSLDHHGCRVLPGGVGPRSGGGATGHFQQ